MVDIEKELQSARMRLLDLTMRNRLLNFRPSKSRTIRVIDEIPSEIYDILVLQERAMQFLSKPGKSALETSEARDARGSLQENHPGSELAQEEASILWELPPADTKLADRYTDNFLQTSLESGNLQQRLFYIYQDSRSVLEELGYSTLYLAIAFLEWTESNGSKITRLAPLILIPVELERSAVRAAFKLSWNGEDISTNISLKEILANQQIDLPDFEMPENKDEINGYLQTVARAIKSRSGWHILNDIYLGFFSFTKFIMYKDIDPAAWPEGKSPVNHPLIQAIFGATEQGPSETGFQESEVDEKLKSEDLFHVLDADSSQIAVIEDVKAGRNLVVEGPPGTGKSQTIVNMIAELIAANKSVLFVSEKMAALEVVKSRLDQAGLGKFCLELHSRKSNKKEFLNNLQQTLFMSSPEYTVASSEYAKLETAKTQLNSYVKALREPFGKIQMNPFALFMLKDSAQHFFESQQEALPRLKMVNAGACDGNAYDEAKRMVNELAGILPMVAPITANPWRGCSPGNILPADEDVIAKSIKDCMADLNDLQTKAGYLAEACGTRPISTLTDVPQIVKAAGVVAVSQPIERDVLSNLKWNKPNQFAEILVTKLSDFQAVRSRVLSKFKEEILEQNVDSLIADYKIVSAKFLKILDSRYRKSRQEVLGWYISPPHKSDAEILSDLEELKRCLDQRKVLRGYKLSGRALFGSLWQGENSEPETLRAFADWILSFRRLLLDKVLIPKTIDIVNKGVSREGLEKAAQELSDSEQNFRTQLEGLAKQVGANYEAIFGKKLDSVSLADLLTRLTSWESEISKLQRWSQYIAIRNRCLRTAGAPLVSEIEKDTLGASDLLPCFEGNFADEVLALVFRERSELAGFVGDLHENKIQQFIELDQKVLAQNQRRLVQKLYQNLPSKPDDVSPGSELGILLGEFNRKRRLMPIRKLMSLSGSLIQKIKPCFMMSPLSIAQFMDPGAAIFDVIVFDEASQVRPEDALGALLRGKQVVVIGDTQQLPPTTFFDRILEDGDEEEGQDGAYGEMESILHQCRRIFYPPKVLRWHYRSRHESLIAISNQEFYNNQLLFYPSPIQSSPDLGLHLVHLPDTIYDRGSGQTNRLEARAIVERSLDHYRRYPNKSLGIGAFNIKQQQVILEEIELQLLNNPEMESYFRSERPEHFFVKNLETIQGDERDVIFISVGYGRDKAGRMTLNFGPLNNEGGERRLNVLVTRAREKCLVFSNFKGKDLLLEDSSPRGLKALKSYLDFAETWNCGTAVSGKPAESPFSDAVYESLVSQGYKVQKQVGCAGFRVDLAVVNPKSPGSFLLGIECDGAKYYLSPVARDRDRLRQQILENLGWHIHRVWSTDWYRNHAEVEKRLVEAIEGRRDSREAPLKTVSPPAEGESSELTVTGEDHLQVEGGKNSIFDQVHEYEVLKSIEDRPVGEIYALPARMLAEIIARVVEIEGPIHFDEVVRRIRTLWGLNRTGARVYEAINEAKAIAVKYGLIREKGKFLWSMKGDQVFVRRRGEDPPPRIELISDEEIAAAIELALKNQFATPPDDLAVMVSRLLGFKVTNEKTAEKIGNVIDQLIEQKKLQKLANGLINLA